MNLGDCVHSFLCFSVKIFVPLSIEKKKAFSASSGTYVLKILASTM